jgi:CRISPR-associated protein Cas5d
MERGDLEGLGLSVDEDRQQRATIALRQVAYVIEAHFEMTAKAGDETPAKHIEMFKRRATKGQCFHRPYLGCREFAADFELVDGAMPVSTLPADQRNRDLGWMLYDIDFASEDKRPMFFHARLRDGVIDVAGARKECLAS